MFRCIWYCRDRINPFHVTGLFPYFLKTSENLIAKLSAYGFRKTVFSIVTDYFTNSLHFIKIGLNFSSHFEIFRVIPQGSIIGQILFTLLINDPMSRINETEVCNFADDTAICTCSLD